MKIKIPKTLTQQAYELIREEILRGGLDGRHRLTEGYFAKRFGISKSPIREALNRLESEGLIKILPRRGAYVFEFSPRDVEEIYQLREILESSVVLNLHLDSKTAARLHSVVNEANASMRRNDREKYIRLDASFHSILAQANPNSRLRKALENMHDQMLILRRRTFALSSHSSVKQHLQILKALERGARQTAAQLMIKHLRTVCERLLSDMSAGKERQSAATRETKQGLKVAPSASG